MPVRRQITKPWFVRFHDGETLDAQPGETISVLAADRQYGELYVLFESRNRRGWWSWESVLWYTDRIFDETE